MTFRRVALVGLNDPVAIEPRKALWPFDEMAVGYSLWKLTEARTGATQYDYLKAFHRYSLGTDKYFNRSIAAEWWKNKEQDLIENFDTIVLVGRTTRLATSLILPNLYVSRSIVAIPHPSIYNKWYSKPVNRQMVEILMEELYSEAVYGV